MVSDSYTIFLTGKKTTVDLAGDLIQQTANGVFSQYRAVIYHPLWGKTLPLLVDEVVKSVNNLWSGLASKPWNQQVAGDHRRGCPMDGQ